MWKSEPSIESPISSIQFINDLLKKLIIQISFYMSTKIGAVHHAKEEKVISLQPIVFKLFGSEMEIEAHKKSIVSYDYINAPNFVLWSEYYAML